MPKISVVVPVHNVEGYVRQCLASILDQPQVDVEVIVVDDHSTDRSSGIIAEVAAKDPRVSILRPEENVGLGVARNLGLSAATGEYVLFVDSDDFLLDGALRLVQQRATETGADLVVFDYERVYWNDRRQRNVMAPIFKRHRGVITLKDEMDLLRLLNVAWNKAYRREFLVEAGLEFPEGYYEDIPFTYPALALASSIALLDRVCIAYRQRRGGSILRSVDTRHLEILEQVKRLFDLVDQRPELSIYRDAFWERSTSHILAVLAAGERRLPAEHRRQFFMDASAILQPLKPEILDPDSGRIQKLKVELLVAGRYDAFQGLKRANGIRFKSLRVKRAVVERARKRAAVVRNGYQRVVGKPEPVYPELQNRALFTSLWNRPPVGNPLAIYRKLQELAPEVEALWVVRDTWADQVDPEIPYILSNAREYKKIVESSRWLINDVNFPNHIVSHPEQIHLQTQHGTPLKFMGLDLQAYPVAADGMKFGPLMGRVDKWTHLLSSNRFSTEVWTRAFPAEYEILEYGYPRNDILIDPPVGLGEQVREDLGIPAGNLVVLYTPTHRDGADSFELGLDPAAFIEAVGPGVSLVVRGHYFYDSDRSLRASGLIVDGSIVREIEHLYLASDVMITDYSSAMFDFALLDRPIAIFGYDWKQYRAHRGCYFDIMKEPPGPAVETFDELVSLFRDKTLWGAESTLRREQFRSVFCTFDDGSASERVIRKLFFGEEPELPKGALEPSGALDTWNVWRPG